MAGVDNEACVGWLDGALRRAFEDGRPELRAYLEAVMDEVLFEMKDGPSVVPYLVKGV